MRNLKIITLFILISLILSAFCGCSEGEQSKIPDTSHAVDSSTVEDTSKENSEESEAETTLPSFVFDTPADSQVDLSKKEYTAVKNYKTDTVVSKIVVSTGMVVSPKVETSVLKVASVDTETSGPIILKGAVGVAV
jgi:hypothetical protein